MENTKNNKRRDFLMNVCPTVAMAFLGVTVLDSCSTTTETISTTTIMVETIMEVQIKVIQ